MPSWPAGAPKTLGLLGDSTTITDYLLWSDTYGEILRPQIGAQMTNYAINGRKTQDYVDGAQAPPFWSGCDAYLIRFGFNEDSVALFESATNDLLDIIEAAGSRAVLATNYFVDYAGGHYSSDRDTTIESYNDALRAIAATRDYPLLDLWDEQDEWSIRIRNPVVLGLPADNTGRSDPRVWDSALDGDGFGGADDPTWYTEIHPNPAGCQILAAATAAFLNAWAGSL